MKQTHAKKELNKKNYKAEAKKIRDYLSGNDYRNFNGYGYEAKSLAWYLFRSKAEDRISLTEKIINRKRWQKWEELSESAKTNFLFIEKVKERLTTFAYILPSSGYAMGEIKKCSALNFTGTRDLTKEYARSCTWKAKHGTIAAKIPVEYAVKGRSLGGLITIIGQKVRGNIYHCKWLEINQIKKYCEDCKVVEKNGFGFYYIDIYNTKRFYHATTYAEAVAECKKSQTAEKKYKKDRESKKKNAAIWQAVTKKDMKALKMAVGAAKLKKLYNFGDSVNAGNCGAGTLNFFRLCGYDRNESATGSDIISRAFRFAPDTLNYMVKIFLYR